MPSVQHSNQAGTDLHEDKRFKQPVRAASTGNVNVSSPGSAIDGVTLTAGDRILLKDQTAPAQNGIYVWTTSISALTRSSDLALTADFVYGFLVYVREGTANGAKTWQYTQSAAVTVGTTAITFVQLISGSAGAGTVTSVALTMPSDFAVGGSPITTSGTLAVTATTQTANTVKAGPTTGAAAAPTYRALVAADVPVMGASGASHAAGAAPDPGGVSGAVKFLREDATWVVPPGASSNLAGARMRHSANQSATSASALVLNWDTEDTDTDTMHYTSSSNLTGTVAKTATANTLVGSSTLFTTELSVGQVISVPGTAAEVKVVTIITDDTHLTVNSNFANTASGQTAARVNSAVVIRTPGFYDVEAGIYSAALSSGLATLQIRLNGSTIISQTDKTGVNASAGYDLATLRSFAQWDYVEVLWTQNSGGAVNVLSDERTHFALSARPSASATSTAFPYVQVQDQKSSGTHAGGATAGSYTTRTLNTIVSDTGSIASLSSNQITLPGGTYYIVARVPAYLCNQHQSRWQNITDGSTTLLGTSEYSDGSRGSTTWSEIRGLFTIATSKAFAVQQRVTTSAGTDGLGVAAGFGNIEIYTSVEVWKQA